MAQAAQSISAELHGHLVPAPQSALVIVNPVSGPGGNQAVFDFLESNKDSLPRLEIYKTSGKSGEESAVVRERARDFDRVIAAGGDGTVTLVARGLYDIGFPVPLGVIPTGTGNAFARELGIPVNIAESAALALGQGKLQKLDSGIVRDGRGGEYLLMTRAGLGFEAQVSRDVTREQKKRFGQLAYAVHSARLILTAPMHHYRIQVDNQPPVRVLSNEIFIVRHPQLAFPIAEPRDDGLLHDGNLYIGIVSANTVFQRISVALRLIVGQLREVTPNVHVFPVQKRVVISSRRPRPTQVDGEETGPTPLSVDVLPAAIHVIAPVTAP